MLSQLTIRDFALVDHLELDFAPGLTVLTGETGAGKSIMLDALSLTLGQRADAGFVRHGSPKADISACFDVSQNTGALTWLAEHDLSDESYCLLRRVINSDGRSRAFINGRPVPNGQLKELSVHLANIHSQHGHQALANTNYQRELIDAFGNLEPQAKNVRDLAYSWSKLTKELAQLAKNPEDGLARRQLLEYQVKELSDLALQDGELEALEEEQGQLSNAAELLNVGEQLGVLINDEAGLRDLINKSLHLIEHAPVKTSALESARDLLATAQIHIDEADGEVSTHQQGVELDPERLHVVNQRLQDIYDIARKHRVLPEALVELTQAMSSELEGLDNIEVKVAEIQQQIEEVKVRYDEAATVLHEQRLAASKLLCERVDDQLKSLAMADAHLSVEWEQLSAEPLSTKGCYTPTLYIQTNPGIPAGPLSKVASGGELSRVALAIAVVTASTATVPTVFFDEVDVGIGGVTASKIGQLMRSLGERMQVLSVTHQPQVAAQAHQHWRVSKRVQHGLTSSALEVLSAQDRTEELARMLGGQEVQEQTRLNAQALLDEVVH